MTNSNHPLQARFYGPPASGADVDSEMDDDVGRRMRCDGELHDRIMEGNPDIDEWMIAKENLLAWATWRAEKSKSLKIRKDFARAAALIERGIQMTKRMYNYGTYADVAAAVHEEQGRRYAVETKLAPITDASRQPASSPWARDPVGPERPLGYRIDETPIVGEPQEIEAAASRLIRDDAAEKHDD